MKSTLQRYFQGWDLQVDRGVRPAGVLVAVLAIAMLAISPAAGALVDDTRAPQQQTTLPDGNTTTAPENATTTTNATTTASNEAESSNNSTANESNNSSSEVSFRFPNQTINGSRIGVEAPRLPNGGFLVIHDSSYPNNGLGSTIGVSEYIAPNSSYNGAEIRLFDVPGRSFDQDRLQSSTTLYVAAALDTNGNQQYDYLTTAGAQDVGYVADGRQAVLSAQIEVNQSDIGSSPAEQYGLGDAGSSGSDGSDGTQAQSDSQAGTGSSSDSDSSSGSGSGSENGSESMSDIISGGSGDANPIGAGSSNSNGSGSGSGSDDTPALLSAGEQISQLGPLLALVGGVGLLIYLRRRS